MTEDDNRGGERSTVWARGDYHAFAKQTVWEVGRELVEAAGIGPGLHVLDIGAGTGNAALRAAQAGASVIASDVTAENFAAGRREAQALGLALEWVAADAQALPFEAHEFDVVMSCFGAIFAPDHKAVADEMVRVCRPRGTIAMANFPPQGLAASFFEILGRHAPAPPGSASPLEWGDGEHVRDLFAERVESLELTPRVYVERAASPREYVRLYRETFGPVVAIYDTLAGEPERVMALEREFLDFAERSNRAGGEPAEYPYEYLILTARRR
ncbi:class I SAM-dependent methyltransferase [soil metagenome]